MIKETKRLPYIGIEISPYLSERKGPEYAFLPAILRAYPGNSTAIAEELAYFFLHI